MPYFHNRMITIIGAKAFHGPVRDGKEWFHLAMVVRRNLYNNVVFESRWFRANGINYVSD